MSGTALVAEVVRNGSEGTTVGALSLSFLKLLLNEVRNELLSLDSCKLN